MVRSPSADLGSANEPMDAGGATDRVVATATWSRSTRPGGHPRVPPDVPAPYHCGDRRPTDDKVGSTRRPTISPSGAPPSSCRAPSFDELGYRLGPRLPALGTRDLRYPFIAHGTGLVDEYPWSTTTSTTRRELTPGMVISVESYVGVPGGHEGVKLEEQVIIGEHGPNPRERRSTSSCSRDRSPGELDAEGRRKFDAVLHIERRRSMPDFPAADAHGS